MEALGEVAGREGLEACEHHLKLIREWDGIPDVGALRRFLGTFNWVRGHFPKEVQVPVARLSMQLRKGAVFPLSDEQEKAKREIQRLACEAVRLQSIDMIGVATGERPLEQVADYCPFGWGGTVYQLSPDNKTLNVSGMYGGSLSLAQSNWHPRRGELYAQRETRREARKHLGRLPAICWTDYSA